MRRLFIVILALLPFQIAHALSEADLLEPDKAFRFSARAIDAATLEVRYVIADGYYLYRARFAFAAEPATVRLGTPQFPKGEVHEDKFFGKQEIYRGDLRVRIPVGGAPGSRLRLTATSQGCADLGLCYVPQDQSAELRLVAGGGDSFAGLFGGGAKSYSSTSAPSANVIANVPASEETRFAGVLESGRLWAIMAAFFVAGLLLTFTPCVLPMIPILSGIIVGEGRGVTRRRAFLLSLAYVGGMAVTYTGIGIGAALSGSLLSAALQNAWVLGAFAIIFVLLALSTFGFYELQLPSGWHARLSDASNRLGGGHWLAVALMGVLSAAIVSPCVAAPLAGALLYISQTRDTLIGGTALFSMALGMGVPLIAVGVSEGALLPKAGHWMRGVKKFFGVLLLAVAIWIVAPVIPVSVQMFLWGALLIGSGVFLRAFDSLGHEASGWTRLWKAIGIIALLVGVAQIAGALSGARDPLRPLANVLGPDTAHAAPLSFERVRSVAELDARLHSPGRPVMLDFYADWCVSCKEMERFTFEDARVRERFGSMLLLRADVTANSAEDKALLKRFRLFGPPGIVFFDASGREIPGLRVIGYQSAAQFIQSLDVAAAAR